MHKLYGVRTLEKGSGVLALYASFVNVSRSDKAFPLRTNLGFNASHEVPLNFQIPSFRGASICKSGEVVPFYVFVGISRHVEM